jgi:hypothetical protein
MIYRHKPMLFNNQIFRMIAYCLLAISAFRFLPTVLAEIITIGLAVIALLHKLINWLPILNILINRYLGNTKSDATKQHDTMSLDEARAILGVDSNATKEEIHLAYKRLMNKLHPDHDGSSYLAAKINQARDTLLRKIY